VKREAVLWKWSDGWVVPEVRRKSDRVGRGSQPAKTVEKRQKAR